MIKIEYVCLIRSPFITNNQAARRSVSLLLNMFKVYENITISTSYHGLVYTHIAQSTDLVQIVEI